MGLLFLGWLAALRRLVGPLHDCDGLSRACARARSLARATFRGRSGGRARARSLGSIELAACERARARSLARKFTPSGALTGQSSHIARGQIIDEPLAVGASAPECNIPPARKLASKLHVINGPI